MSLDGARLRAESSRRTSRENDEAAIRAASPVSIVVLSGALLLYVAESTDADRLQTFELRHAGFPSKKARNEICLRIWLCVDPGR